MLIAPRLLGAAIAAAVAFPSLAMRLEYVAEHDGKRLAGAEICFFATGDETDLPRQFLHSGKVRCMPADDVIDVTPGHWGYYLRHRDGLVSMLPGTANIAPGAQEAGYKQVFCEMRSAATLDVASLQAKLAPDEWLAVYVAHDGRESTPVAVPIPCGEPQFMVPASVPLVLLSVRGGQVTNVSDPMTLPRQERRTIGPFPPAGPRATLIAWVTLPKEAREQGSYWSRIRAPHVTLDRGKEHVAPKLEIRDGFGSDGALLLFRGVARGTWSLRLGGGVWRRDGLPVDVAAPLTVASRTLVTAPASSLRLRWATGASVTSASDCLPQTAKAAATSLRVSLSTCEGLTAAADPARINPARCRATADAAEIDAASRSALFEALPAGTYLAEVREPGFPVRRAVVTTATGEATTADLDLSTFDVSGRVTLGEAPLRARLQFATGTAVSDESGHYDARLEGDPGASPIGIFRCGEERPIATHIPLPPVERGRPYDIAIPANAVHVRVLDAATHKPLADAVVQCAAMMEKDSDTANFLSQVHPTDANGESTVPNVPTAYDISICAMKGGYERLCGERFSMKGERETSTTIELAPLKHRGILHARQPIRGGLLFFVAGGHVVERVNVAEDGTFNFKSDHMAPEYVVATAVNGPLFVVPLPAQPPEVLEVTAPAIVRTVSITIAPSHAQKDALIGLLLEGLYIPNEALFHHQAPRGDQPLILGGTLMKIAAVGARSIAVILGPSPYEIGQTDPDEVFTRPERRVGTITKEVGASGAVTFE
jgi:hypothetical protein